MAVAPILSWEGLGLIQGTGWLFRDLDLFIGPRDRLALIGRNGAGKTTLLRLIAHLIEADQGKRSVQPGTRIVLLEQDPFFTGFDTLMDFALKGPDAPPRHAVEAIADQIGIDLSRPAEKASGGERRRAALCRALACEPDLLLLDEPTNHLDLAAIDWLENWLSRYTGAFIVISHDRTFLKRLTSATLWLDRGTLRRKEVGFGGYEAWEEQVYAEEARAAEKLDAKLKIEAHWLERGVTARRKRNQGRLEKLYEMRTQRAAMLAPSGAAKLKLATDDVKTKSVIVAEHVWKSFPTPARPEPVEGLARASTGSARAEVETKMRTIIKDFSLRIQRGDRIGLVGANGSGKTTLLKILTGEIEPDEGEVTLAKTLHGTVIDQQRSLLAPEKRLRDVLAEGGDWVDVRGHRKHVQGYLKEFLFDPGLADAKVGTLSGGERSRLLLAREFARKSNLLVLDEPTNDLDLETLDLLQEVIADYDGTVLIVSHDRDFLDRTVTITLGLDGSGQVDIIAGGYADWEAKRKKKAAERPRKTPLPQAEGAGGGPVPASSDAPSPLPPPASGRGRVKLSYKDQRDYDLLPARIEELDAAIARDETALADPDLYTSDPAKFSQLTEALEKARAEKEAAEERWLELAEMVEG